MTTTRRTTTATIPAAMLPEFRRLTRAHGGRIVRSAPTRLGGDTFTVTATIPNL